MMMMKVVRLSDTSGKKNRRHWHFSMPLLAVILSFFSKRGKKFAWQAYPEATEAFTALCSKPPNVPKTVMESLERFVVLMYDRTSELQGADAARRYLFFKKSREIWNIPPTAAAQALLEHTKTAAVQAGHIWGQCLVHYPCVLSPGDLGSEMCDGQWEVVSGQRSPRQQRLNCYELLSCKCKKTCKGTCKCHRANLQCTSLCACDGQCYGNWVSKEAWVDYITCLIVLLSMTAILSFLE